MYLGAPLPFNNRAFEAAREQAEQMGARFIDARSTPWPEDYGGPKTYMVTPEYINALVKAYGAHSQKPDPTPRH